MANLKLRRWLIKGPSESERGGCRERKTNCGLLLWRRCKAEQPAKVFVGKDEREKRKPLYQANHKGFVSEKQHQALSPAQHQPAIIFLHSILGDCVVRLPQLLSAGVAAQTLLTYVSLRLAHPNKCTVRCTG
jgi:hypothetical protein